MRDAHEGGSGEGETAGASVAHCEAPGAVWVGDAGPVARVDLREHMRRIRALVKPENCARPKAKARKAANARWAKVREKNALQVAAV